jgi:hypothetical protein
VTLHRHGKKVVRECQLSLTGHREWEQLIAPRVHMEFVGGGGGFNYRECCSYLSQCQREKLSHCKPETKQVLAMI